HRAAPEQRDDRVRDPPRDPAQAKRPARLHGPSQRAPRGRRRPHRAGEGGRAGAREQVHAQDQRRPAQGLPPRALRPAGAMMEANKRAGDRLTINKEFESFDAFIQEYVTNISRTGVFIKAAAPLAVGTKVNLHFTIIMDGIETIEGTGEVVRVEK